MALNGMQSYVGIPGRKVSEPQPDDRRQDEKKIDSKRMKGKKPAHKFGKPANFGKLMRPQAPLSSAKPGPSSNRDGGPEEGY